MNKGLKIVLIVLACIVVLGGIIVAVLLLTTGGDRQKAADFVSSISSGDTATAYGQFSPALKEVQSESVFASQIATLGLDDSCELKVSGVESSASTSNGSQVVVDGSVECEDKTFETATFTYRSEGLYAYSIR